MHQLESLRSKLDRQVGDAGDVAAGPIETGHNSELNGVDADLEDDGDRRGRLLGRERSRATADRGNRADTASDQIGRQGRQLAVVTLRGGVLDPDVASLLVADFLETLPKGDGQSIAGTIERIAGEEAHHRRRLRP